MVRHDKRGGSSFAAGALLMLAVGMWQGCATGAAGAGDDDDDGGSSNTNAGGAGPGAGGMAVGPGNGGAGAGVGPATTGPGAGGSAAGPSTGGMGTGGMAPACLDGGDCGANMVCDLDTQTCGALQCDATLDNCPGGASQVCFDQTSMVGACYDNCTPYTIDAECGAGQHCFDTTSPTRAGVFGVCLNAGPAGYQQPCTSHDTSTGCALDHTCVDGACLEECDYWGQTQQCDVANEDCFITGFCQDLDTMGVSNAAIGAVCPGVAGDLCGKNGDRFDGVCVDFITTPICRETCRFVNGLDDCTAGTVCDGTPLFLAPYDYVSWCE